MPMVEPPGRAQDWSNCDDDINAFVRRTVAILAAQLASNLVGVYLHGSLAMASYFRPKSDIDLLVVARHPLTTKDRRRIALALTRHMPNRPTVGNLELSVITADTARSVPVPVPYEVHVSSMWEEAVLADEVEFGALGMDPDLPAHLTHVRQRGICLYGSPIDETFGDIAWDAFLAAVEGDAAWVLAGRNILNSPVYGVLNVCRVLQLRQQNGHLVHSKDEAARWAIGHLPERRLGMVRLAWMAYRSEGEVCAAEQQTAGLAWPEAELLSFRDFARSQLGLS